VRHLPALTLTLSPGPRFLPIASFISSEVTNAWSFLFGSPY
jgi:hypothetical protein